MRLVLFSIFVMPCQWPAEGLEDPLVVVGHMKAQVCDQVGSDVNADLDCKLNRMLRGKSIAKPGLIERVAPRGPNSLSLFEELGGGTQAANRCSQGRPKRFS